MASEAGNKNPNDETKLPPEFYQEDALHHDYYRDEDKEGPHKTREQNLQRLKQLDNKECCPWRLDEVYPNTAITTPEKLEQRIEQLKQFEEQKECKEYCETSENHSNDIEKQHENNDGSEK